MEETLKEQDRIIIAGVHTGALDGLNDTTEESMRELSELVETAGGIVVGEMVQNRQVVETGTYFGEGKLEELKNAADTLEADMIVVDDELTGSQIRNIADATGVSVIDRNTLILDIFAQRAKSAEGKIQVALAQLKYMLPRLSGMGKALSRQGGGIGTRGPGETKLESDRRHIMRRVSALSDELAEIEKRRDFSRQRRKKDGVKTAAIVGYTNAGKSTLLNIMTGAEVTARNRLFETLDLTGRALELSDSRSVRLIDTVGFIRRLPHQFIEAFKSTLEEASSADIIIHVIDSSSPEMENHIKVVRKLLSELGCDEKPVIGVFNKIDVREEELLGDYGFTYQVEISAKNGENLDKLIEAIEEALPGKKKKAVLLIPYTDGAVVSEIHENELIISTEYTEEGTLIEAMLDAVTKERYKKYERV
ncbi:MAG: GTPase HflX [Clostridia bacterium]|nr:GTPase HflX [Clostridia bacterium]